MTDLTTMHLKCLLEQATPGPWKLDPETGGIKNSASDNVVRGDANRDGDEVWLEWSFGADHMLAAHAPELAQEVIRLRGEIKGLITAMEEKAATGESQSPAIIAGYLKEIVLGEANE